MNYELKIMNYMKKSLSVILTLAVALSANTVQAQGVLGIFKSDKKDQLEKNAPSLRQHLKERRGALLAWNAIPADE